MTPFNGMAAVFLVEDVGDADRLLATLNRMAQIRRLPSQQPCRMRELGIADPNGRAFVFGQDLPA